MKLKVKAGQGVRGKIAAMKAMTAMKKKGKASDDDSESDDGEESSEEESGTGEGSGSGSEGSSSDGKAGQKSRRKDYKFKKIFDSLPDHVQTAWESVCFFYLERHMNFFCKYMCTVLQVPPPPISTSLPYPLIIPYPNT